MSASPTIAASSTKRPLEEPSSPTGPNDQPDAKRPALDKMVKDVQNAEEIDMAQPVKSEGLPTDDVNDATVKSEESAEALTTENGAKDESDTLMQNAPPSVTPLETQPILSTSSVNGRSSAHQQQDETNWLHLRACIGTSEAATIIGKGGENVTQIRRLSGAKCTVSDYSRGAVERILTVSGQVDAVSKVCHVMYRCPMSDVLILGGFRSYRPYSEPGRA